MSFFDKFYKKLLLEFYRLSSLMMSKFYRWRFYLSSVGELTLSFTQSEATKFLIKLNSVFVFFSDKSISDSLISNKFSSDEMFLWWLTIFFLSSLPIKIFDVSISGTMKELL